MKQICIHKKMTTFASALVIRIKPHIEFPYLDYKIEDVVSCFLS